ncbi:MAG TPA: penicillin acylase family protein [Acidobacteriaceae bacterium]|nr:penicillin acylase family protein [Acidobacteriaceae bacterium]
MDASRRTSITSTRRRPHSRPHSWIRKLFTAIVILAAVACVVLVLAAIWLRHSMRAALPQIDGTLHVAGLHAPVAVTRNAQGVPSIHAANIDDLLFAQGFVTAQDRLWQMDILRRHAAGELAEILGPGLVEHDKRQRYLQLRATADRAAQTLPPDQLHELESYARGVNAFIATHRNRLPVEFHLLHYTPRPWSPRDSLLISIVMWQDLSTDFPQKLDRESLSRHLPPSLLAALYPVGSWRDRPPTQPPTDLTGPHIIEQIPLDPTQSKLNSPNLPPTSATPHDLLAITAALTPSRCDTCRAGSNNWALSGAHSASGAPLVSNDMHLGLSLPDIWYEAVLHVAASSPSTSPLDVAGFTLPGVPWVLVGRNPHLAWSFTNLGADVQDIRIEHLRGSGASTEFEQLNGAWLPVEHHTEHIIVRGGRDVSLDVKTVSHAFGSTTVTSPIISPLFPSEHRTLSLAWTLYDPANLDFSFRATDASADSASLVASFAAFGGPSLNLVYADDDGHIGYHALGRIPIRGPAVQHPRTVPQFILPGPEPDSDEDDETQTSIPPPIAPQIDHEPNASPHSPLQLTAYEPARRHSRRRARLTPRNTTPDQSPPADQPTLAPPPAESYTIGSPISPVPIDALDANQAWSSYISYDALPSMEDPSSGVLATANARVTSDDYTYALALDWVDPYRAERIYHLLEGRSDLTPQSMLAVQTDQHSAFDLLLAQRIAYAIDHSSVAARGNDTARLRQAADLLRDWHGNMNVTSSAAAIVAATNQQLWPSLLIPQIVAHDRCSHATAARLAKLYVWDERTSALESLVANNPANWLPPGVANWDDLLTLVAERGLRSAHAPGDLSRWRYGSIHTVEMNHPLFGDFRLLHWLFGVATGTGPQPAGGDTTTIDAISPGLVPSERFTADLSSPDATLANITTGESGNPASAWYLDQFSPWLHGTSFNLPLTDSGKAHSLTLTP